MRFPVVLHSGDEIRFGVTVLDLPGCFSAGDTFDQALDLALEALDLHLDGIAEDGVVAPVPHTIAKHRANPDFSNGVRAAVEVDVSRFGR